MSRFLQSHRPFRQGHFAMLAAIVTEPLLLAWMLLGNGVGGSLGACFPSAPWLRDAVGGFAMVAFCFAIGLALVSLVGRSWRWGLGAVAVLLASTPVVFVVALIFLLGDPAADVMGRCPFG